MTPPLIHLYNFETGESLASNSTRGAKTMYIPHLLDSRSIQTGSVGGSGGLERNTIIFIAVGVVCLFVLLIGFFLVSRPRVPSNAATSPLSSHSPTGTDSTPPRPRRRRDKTDNWRICKIWPHDSSSITSDPPTTQLSPTPIRIPTPSPIIPARTHSKDKHAPAASSRPTRRVTSPSVQTNFSHSHITQEALHNYHACAYDLDGDLIVEMLHSARDDVGPEYPVDWGSDHASAKEAVDLDDGPGGNDTYTPNIGGGVGCGAAITPASQTEGGDYESVGAILEEVIIGPRFADPAALSHVEGERIELQGTRGEELKDRARGVEDLS